IQLEALEAECDRLRHDAAQAKSLATEVVFLKRQVAELEMEGTMKNTDADTVESLKAQAENSVRLMVAAAPPCGWCAARRYFRRDSY
ncbi:hypothetical protein FOZ63_023590, partial [Perkinsus olseni]